MTMGTFQQFLNDKKIDTAVIARLSAQLEARQGPKPKAS
jgi:hypothetical protein